jgi:Ca-activated chloride channel homolog
MLFIRILFLVLFSASMGKTTSAQGKDPELVRILFIFDASNSMWGQWGKNTTKIESARIVLASAIDSLRGIPNLELALRIYGHQVAIEPGKQDCNDTKLEIPFGKDNHQAIINRVRTVIPKGTTPIARSLEYCAQDFPDKNSRNIVILITDGIEACDEDPCAVSRALQSKGIMVKPFVVGIGLDISHLQGLTCIGTYYDANDEKEFGDVLKQILAQALNNSSVQINLLNTERLPKETNVTCTFYDQYTGGIKKSLMHTLNYKGNPDTITMEPLGTYRMVVHTIPPVEIRDIKIKPGEHNVIEAYTPQGFLSLRMRGFVGRTHIPAVIRKSGGDGKTIHAQYLNSTEKLITGKYDLEVLTIPRLHFKDVEISQSKTTSIEIPKTGYLRYSTGRQVVGQIFKWETQTDEWVWNLNPDVREDTIEMLPGKYKIVLRETDANKTIHTREVFFTIISGEQTKIQF